jgi:nicotinamidase-related amidase
MTITDNRNTEKSHSISPNAALLIIDVQQGIDDDYYGTRNNLFAEDNIVRLLATWRENRSPVIFVQHLSLVEDSPLREGQPGCAIKKEVAPLPSEPVIQKHTNSAFIGTDLEQHLRSNNIDTLVVTGLTTQHCVSTTVRMAGNLGFDVYLIADATAANDATGFDGQHYSADEVHNVSLATLNGEFCTVVDTDELLSEL